MDKYIILKIKPRDNYEEFVDKYYSNHSTYHKGDAGIDLFCPDDIIIPANSLSNKINLGIICSAQIMKDHFINYNTQKFELDAENIGFHLYPRSSMGKTPLRLSNSVGIIDSGYRGELIALVDNFSNQSFNIKKGERYFQICFRKPYPINLKITHELDKTERGSSGFGSTGK